MVLDKGREVLRGLVDLLPRRAYLPLWRVRRRLHALAYIGNRVRCPCCGGAFRRFADYRGARECLVNIECPGCGAFERHRLLWLYLRDRTDLFRSRYRMLHVAPEVTFLLAFRRLQSLDYVAVDVEARVADARMDVASLGFAGSTFDVILCSHVLEHVRDDRGAMLELFRVLRPGGWAIVQSPVDLGRGETFEDASIVSPEGRAQAFGQHDHVRLYGRDYPARLGQAGFDVEEVRYARDLPPTMVAATRINPDEVIYLCRKPARAAA